MSPETIIVLASGKDSENMYGAQNEAYKTIY